MLNFDAVDWKADVYVNDIQIGSHTGGYTHFGFDVTPYLKSGANTLVVKVADATDNDFQPRGKQVMNPRGIWYTPVSGIWQSVWIEPVATAHVADYNVVSDQEQFLGCPGLHRGNAGRRRGKGLPPRRWYRLFH